jgi:uncharacterized Fe-S center protein
MSILQWSRERNIENSLYTALATAFDGITVINNDGAEQAVTVNIGKSPKDTWTLPCISLYVDNISSPRAEIGSNLRNDVYTFIIDIRTLNDGMRADLVDYIQDAINNGFTYFEYTYNPLTVGNMDLTTKGYVTIDWLTNQRLDLGDDVDLLDKFRHRLSLTAWITWR